MTPDLVNGLPSEARAIRKKFLEMHFRAQAGHIGTGLSCIDLLTYLYKQFLKPSDRFILSKGHGASALYATLHHVGQISDAEIATYYQDGSLLPAHPAAGAFESMPAATGSLGHGLPIATGMAYAFKQVHGSAKRVTCLMSDGECNEGTTWEAALFSAHHKLDNLIVIVDANGLQGFGRTDEVLDMRPLPQKWAAFGFEVEEINGHDFKDIHRALSVSPRQGKPRCVIARTIKGKGVSFMENKLEWHYLPLNAELFGKATQELEGAKP
jgi:transketolase